MPHLKHNKATKKCAEKENPVNSKTKTKRNNDLSHLPKIKALKQKVNAYNNKAF